MDWYRSPTYQAILPLRTGNAEGDVILVDTVSDDHRAPDVLKVSDPDGDPGIRQEAAGKKG